MKLFSIFGNPVNHSKSPIIHNAVFKKYRSDHRYIRTLVEDGENLKDIYNNLNLSGVSVTVPYKEVAYKLCDEIRGVAKKIGAVNCIVSENKKLIGYNIDVYGFLDSIKDFKEIKDVLIIGAGGTAKALTVGFLEKDWNISILNRTEKRLASFKSMPLKTYNWDNFQIEKYDLVVNVTSAGLNDDSFPVKKETLKVIFQNSRYAVDVIYHETPFLKLAKEMKLETKDGSLMLVYQGVLANQLFTQNRISKDSIEKEMLQAFEFSY